MSGSCVRLATIVADAVVSVVAAPDCGVCGTILEQPARGPVCESCWGSVQPLTPPLCPACGDPLPAGALALLSIEEATAPHCPRCRASRSQIARSRAVGEYSGTLRALVHLLKYEKRRSLASRLALMMATSGAEVLTDADAAVPVPLHWTRQWRRGFNQAALLAAGLGVPVWPAIVRSRATRAQVGLTAHGRRMNVQHAFVLAGRWPPGRRRWRRRLAGRVVVLVDDVSTTGATLESCASVLRAAGAREVRSLTAARVVG